MKINANFNNLNDSYLFFRISQEIADYKAGSPACDIISLGIGDVTRPLTSKAISAMQAAVLEMGDAKTFKGYADGCGYPFLKEAVCGYYAKKGVNITEDEIFISDGAKNDIGNILDIFSDDNTVLVPDPVYPVYVDTNIMAGRPITYINGLAENNFLPVPDNNIKADIIYLCSPNNPTGAVYNKEQLKLWVDYANKSGAVILYDSAYEAFIIDSALPTTIYQIDGARDCAIEFCSFSKTAGFTGVRCGYTIIPSELKREGASLNKLWLRRQTTKHNGVSYIVQRGAQAVFTDEGLREIGENISYYMNNAKIIADTFKKMGIWFTGGENSPYIWLKCPNDMSSWGFFDFLLKKANIVGTPGAGFGKNGEGFFRLTAFGKTEDVREAMGRFSRCIV